MNFIKLNGWSLSKEPIKIEQSKSKLKKEDRTIDGTLVVDIIAIKDKVKIEWDYLSSIDLEKLQGLLRETAFVNLEYFDGKTTRIIKAETDELRCVPYYDSRTKDILWKNVVMTFNEV